MNVQFCGHVSGNDEQGNDGYCTVHSPNVGH